MDQSLLRRWREAYRTTPGWGFQHLGPRFREGDPPWSYPDLARGLLAERGVETVLDMGTGGGELLLSLADALPRGTVATEGFAPNVAVAIRNLAPAGITVRHYDAETDPAMPFPDGSFDLVLNRHEAYAAQEVARVLRPGGTLLTQQVDGRDFREVYDLFGAEPDYPDVRLEAFRAQADRAGLAVEHADEWWGRAEFDDVATLLGFLAMTPWYTPAGFNVDAHTTTLARLHEEGPAKGERLRFSSGRFLLRCRKPATAT